jgi:hypothetical protein
MQGEGRQGLGHVRDLGINATQSLVLAIGWRTAQCLTALLPRVIVSSCISFVLHAIR